MSKVYVTQIPQRHDKATGAFSPVINISPATEHGEVVIMLPSDSSFFATNQLVKTIENHLAFYDYEAGDSLVAVGDPSIIAVACGILGKLHKKFKILKWDKNIGRYIPIHISL